MRACLSLFRFLTHFSLNPASPTTSPFTVADVHAKIADVCATAGRLEAALEAAKAAATIKEECFKAACGVAPAYKMLNDLSSDVAMLEMDVDRLNDLAALFEFPEKAEQISARCEAR